MPNEVALALTGERTVPGIERENYWFRRHEAAYEWVIASWAQHLLGQTVVDAGCGEGYGAAQLAAGGAATPVIGLELDSLAAAHGQRRYAPAVQVLRANLDGLPLATGSAGALISMQVIEHLWDLAGFLRETRRVLKPGGLCVLSTPNRLTFSPGLDRGERPANPFHVEEFDAGQLASIVEASGLASVQVFGLRHGDRLTAWERARGSIVAAQIDAMTEPGPDWDEELLSMVRSITTGDFAISGDDLADCADLIVVAIKDGESA